MSNSKLDDLRRDIDALDSELLKLFQQRAEKAAEIYKAKGKGSPWRPAREAEHLRELCNQVRSAGGALTEQRVRRIWRAIYADSVASQSRLTIYAEQEHEVTVKAHFGNDISFHEAEAFSPEPPKGVLEKGKEEEKGFYAGQSLLKMANDNYSESLAAIRGDEWILLVSGNEFFIHEILRNENERPAGLLVAKHLPEPSGHDWTLVAVRAGSEAVEKFAGHQNAFYEFIGKKGDIEVPLNSPQNNKEGIVFRLILLEGWYAPETFEAEKGAHYLGAFPYREGDLETDE